MKKFGLLWELIMLLLAFTSLAFLVLDITNPGYAYHNLFYQADLLISYVFLADFTLRWVWSQDRNVFFRENWIQLIASLPAVSSSIQAFQLLRLLRFARFLKIYHVHSKLVIQGDKQYDGEAFQTFNLVLIVLTIMFASSLVFYDAEFGTNPNLHTFFDAIWWAFVTITTTGYGDIYPVTVMGRLTAMFLMIFGISTFAVVISAMSQKFLLAKEKFTKPRAKATTTTKVRRVAVSRQ